MFQEEGFIKCSKIKMYPKLTIPNVLYGKSAMRKLLVFILLLMMLPMALKAEKTTIIIRAKAKDAKFIGTSIGGAKVVVRNSLTDEILAQGLTSGSTGNTDLIMKTPHERNKRLSDEETAKFEAVIDISEPVFVTIEVYAPVNKRQALVKPSTQVWLFPGKDVIGDGIVIEIPGFVVDILTPQTHEVIQRGNNSSILPVKANVVMMCGCPTTNGGTWNAEDYEVEAVIKKDGQVIKNVPLKVRGKNSTYEAETDMPESGNYEILIYAYDPQSGNTGADKINIIIK